MKKSIKLFDPVSDKKEERALRKVLDSHFWASGAGQGNVKLFEEKFRKYTGADTCLAVNSGTAALHLALSLFNIKNKEVILPSLSFVSTAHAILYNGGKPVFVDIEPETLCLDPKKVKEKINENTAVILPVHFGGMSCNLDEFSSICKKNKITLVEDAAHAAGTKYKNKKIGSHGNVVCFSFHPVKNLAMPTGGALCLNQNSSKKQTKEKIESLRWCGISDRVEYDYDVTQLGWNFYMNEFSAAIGIEQLKKLEKNNRRRKNIAKKYYHEINVDKKMPFENSCSYHLYWILVENREKFMNKMKKMNIQTGIHYKPIHQMSLYNKKTDLPITSDVGTKIVSIPIHPNLSDSDVDFIIKSVNSSV